MITFRLLACSMLLVAGVASAEKPATFGDAVFGAPVEQLPGIAMRTGGQQDFSPENAGLVVWTRAVKAGVLPAGLGASEVEYDTWDGRLLRVRVQAHDSDGADALKQFATKFFGTGSTSSRGTSWENARLIVRYQEGEFWPSRTQSPAVLTVADKALEREWAAQREERLRQAELEESRLWKGALSGVDSRLDPRLAVAVKSASRKQAWGASLILWGTSLAGGSAALIALSDREAPVYLFGTAGVGVVAVIVGGILSASASNDIDAVTAPR